MKPPRPASNAAVDARRFGVVPEISMSANAPSSWQPSQTPPRPDLPPGGVLLGLLWVAGAFAALFYCFATNHANKPVVPAEELAIAAAAMAPSHAAPQQP